MTHMPTAVLNSLSMHADPHSDCVCSFMSMPLHDQERLGNYSKRGVFDHLPLGKPLRSATHQGLFLSANEDALVGRAENGAPGCLHLAPCQSQ